MQEDSNVTPLVHEGLMNISDAADLLKMSAARIRFEVARKTIPFFKIGRSIRFSRSELNQWIQSKKQGVYCGK